MRTLPKPVSMESRTAFGIEWYATEAEAEEVSKFVVRRMCGTNNLRGFWHSTPIGRADEFDKDSADTGKTIYAVKVP